MQSGRFGKWFVCLNGIALATKGLSSIKLDGLTTDHNFKSELFFNIVLPRTFHLPYCFFLAFTSKEKLIP